MISVLYLSDLKSRLSNDIGDLLGVSTEFAKRGPSDGKESAITEAAAESSATVEAPSNFSWLNVYSSQLKETCCFTRIVCCKPVSFLGLSFVTFCPSQT